MAEDLYTSLEAPIPQMAWMKEYGLSKAIIALWDVSLQPGDSGSFPAKLGRGEVQHGGVICRFDAATNQATLADGTADGAPAANTRRPFNPENWVFRPHYPLDTNGKDGSWDVRLIAEHENQSDSRDNHGTMVVNQKNRQGWGWLNDIAWVRQLGSSVSDPEIMFNGAGFLPQLYGAGSGPGSGDRGAVAIPTARNSGFVTDGKYDGQWAQAGKFIIGPAHQNPNSTSGGSNGTTSGPGDNSVPSVDSRDPLHGGFGPEGSYQSYSGNELGVDAGSYGGPAPSQSGNSLGINAGMYGGAPPSQAGNPFGNGAGLYGGGGQQSQAGNSLGVNAGSYGGPPPSQAGNSLVSGAGSYGRANVGPFSEVATQEGSATKSGSNTDAKQGATKGDSTAAATGGRQRADNFDGSATGNNTRVGNPGQTTTGPNGGTTGGPGQTTTDQNRPMAVEWGMRADCGIDFGAGTIGRFVHEPGVPTDGEGEPRRVYLFCDTVVSPDDGLDTEVDDSSNHPKLPKRVEKKAIRGWVRVPKSTVTNHHYDYSYHGGTHGGSSSSSSSGGSGASTPGGGPVPGGTSGGSGTNTGGVGGGDGGSSSGTGGGTPPTPPDTGGPGGSTSTQTFTDANGNTWTREVTTTDTGATVPTSSWEMQGNAPSTSQSSQADQGHLAPQSPEFSQRTNSHRYDPLRDIVGVMNDTKPQHYTTIYVTVDYKTSEQMLPGQWIVLEVMVSARDWNGLPPREFYSIPIAVGNDRPDRDQMWQQTTWKFEGFPTQAQFLEIYIVRRAMTLGGDFGAVVAATQNLYVCATTLTYAGRSEAPSTQVNGYGFNYGVVYGIGL